MLSTAPHLGGLLGTATGGPLTDAQLRMTGSLRWSRSAIWLVGKVGCGLLFLIAVGMENPYVAVALIGVAALLADSGGPASWAMVTDVGRQHSDPARLLDNSRWTLRSDETKPAGDTPDEESMSRRGVS